MRKVVVVEVPQWQGSAAPRARRLADGARRLAELLPLPRAPRPQAETETESGAVADGAVRHLPALVANLDAVRTVLAGLDDTTRTVTVGGDCGVELAPVERALARHGERLAVVWCDAHGDLNTPESSPSRAFHGMVVRTLLGEGPEALRTTARLSPDRLVLAGVRALDPPERRYVTERGVRHLGVDALAAPSALVDAVAATGADAVYLHIDLDVLDPEHFGAVGVPEPGGLTPDRLAAQVRSLAAHFTLAGIGVTEYEPESDAAAPQATAVLEGLAQTLADAATGADPADVRRIDRHAAEAWPAPERHHHDGWLLRHTPGMRRLRSGNTALPPGSYGDPAAALRAVEAFFAERDLPAAVQVTPAARHVALDERLAARGYRKEKTVHVLTAPARAVAEHASGAPGTGPTVELTDTPSDAWLDAYVALDGEPDARDVAEQIIAKISLPAAFAAVRSGERTAGIGLFIGGDRHWAGAYCMATHPEHRRQGVARAILGAGARWAAGHGADGLYLQVSEANAAARELYARAGFGPGYHYHYRRLAAGDATVRPG